MRHLQTLLQAAAIAAGLGAPAVYAAETQTHTGGIYEAVGPDTSAISAVKTASAGALAPLALQGSASGWTSLLAAPHMLLAIPEAPSAALLIIGLAAVGVAARRRAR